MVKSNRLKHLRLYRTGIYRSNRLRKAREIQAQERNQTR